MLEIENCVVLDIGSGDSEHAELLQPSCILYRIDYPTNARYRLAPDIFADATAIPIAPERVDAVLLLEVLEHIPEDSKALSEIRSVLKLGGKLYMSVPFIYPLHDAPYDFRRYTVHGLRRFFGGIAIRFGQDWLAQPPV